MDQEKSSQFENAGKILVKIRGEAGTALFSGLLGVVFMVGLVVHQGVRYFTQVNVRISSEVPYMPEPSAIVRTFRVAMGRDAVVVALGGLAKSISQSGASAGNDLAKQMIVENSRRFNDPKRAPIQLISNGPDNDMSLVLTTPVPIPDDQVISVARDFLAAVVAGYNADGGRPPFNEASVGEGIYGSRVDVRGQIGALEAELFEKLHVAGFSAPVISGIFETTDLLDPLARASAGLGVLSSRKLIPNAAVQRYRKRIVELGPIAESLVIEAKRAKDGPLQQMPTLVPDGFAFSRLMWQRPFAMIVLGGICGAWMGVLFIFLRSRFLLGSRFLSQQKSSD